MQRNSPGAARDGRAVVLRPVNIIQPTAVKTRVIAMRCGGRLAEEVRVLDGV